MNWIRDMLFRFRGTLRKRQLDAEMAEEMREHLELRIERNLAAGMTPDDARYAAQRSFGGVEQIKERCRDATGGRLLHDVISDLRYALRQLRKTPGFTTVVVLSLALGIGANTAIFSALDHMLLRPLPVEKPQELVRFDWLAGSKGGRPPSTEDDSSRTDPATGRQIGTVFPLTTFEAFRTHHPMLTEVFAFTRPPGFTLEVEGQISGSRGQLVSGGYYTCLGVKAWVGRTLLPEDDQPGAPPVAVISHAFWLARFGGDASVVGKTIWVNRTSVAIVGVTPPDFVDPISVFGEQPFSFPLALLPLLDPDAATKSKPRYWWIRIMGRLQPGATPAQAAASLKAAFEASTRDGLTVQDDPPLLLATPGGHGLIENRWANANPLLVLTGMAALVLLAACVNVANLLLARGAARRREFAVRLALGAGRSRLIRQLLTESALLATLGAALGLLIAAWGGALLPFVGARGSDVVDYRVFGFASAIALLTGIAFGLVPALRATRVDLTAEFQGGTRQLGRGGRTRLGQTLLVVQVALSLVLLVGAGLFVRTLRNLQAIDIGFDRDNLLLFSIDVSTAGYKRARYADLHGQIAEKIAAIPGVRSVTFSSTPLLGNRDGTHYSIDVPGRPERPDLGIAMVNRVGLDFFETFGIPVLLGRGLEARDDPASSHVVVVNQVLANKIFPGQNPIGQRIQTNGDRPAEIVGVVRDVQQARLRNKTVPTVFVPFAHDPWPMAQFAARTTGDPSLIVAAIRNAVKEVERNLPVNNVRTQERQIDTMVSRERAFMRVTSFFGGLALALVCVGLYGLMSYAVVRRTGEIGLRMALGALPANVLRMFLHESVALVLFGVALGVVVALAATRLVAHLLYGLSLIDMPTYIAVALLMISTGLIATLVPAWRASKIDPMVALRCE